MKKLFIIMTLFVSSFFFFKEDVKAYEYSVELDFSLLNEEALSLKYEVEEYLSAHSSYSPNYIIYRPHGQTYVSALIFKSTYDFSNIFLDVSSSTVLVKFGTSVMATYPNVNSYSDFFYLKVGSMLAQIIYTNFDIPISEDLIINYTYGDFTYVDSIETTNKISSLDEIYRNFNGEIIEPENPHQEEIDKVTNFYTMVIEKIEYLSNEISNNYIFLFVIVIFIVIFVFLLIFRRFIC